MLQARCDRQRLTVEKDVLVFTDTHSHTHTGPALQSGALISPQETYERPEHLYIIHEVHSSHTFLNQGSGTITPPLCDFIDLTFFCAESSPYVNRGGGHDCRDVQEVTADTGPGPQDHRFSSFPVLTGAWLSAGGPYTFETSDKARNNFINMDPLLRAHRSEIFSIHSDPFFDCFSL